MVVIVPYSSPLVWWLVHSPHNQESSSFRLMYNFVLQGLLGPKKELWDLFQFVEKWSYEAQDITASVRDLPTVKYVAG